MHMIRLHAWLTDSVTVLHPTRHKQVISEMLLTANLFTSTEKTKPKAEGRTTKIYNKPMLMQTSKFATMQNNQASETLK